MYQKPDFMQVSIKVKDVFANYLATGCSEDEGSMGMWVAPCDSSDKYTEISGSMTALGFGHQCYSTLNP